jgi:hypothetical protein
MVSMDEAGLARQHRGERGEGVPRCRDPVDGQSPSMDGPIPMTTPADLLIALTVLAIIVGLIVWARVVRR